MSFTLYDKEAISSFLSIRKGEQKIGENIHVLSSLSSEKLALSAANFVVLGIPEDIGPRANFGKAGADSAWKAFLSKFVNIQATTSISGRELLLLGHFHFEELGITEQSKHNQLTKAVKEIDEQVSPLIELIVRARKIPIVIGGGHNNAYGLLKGASKALHCKMNCINLDPHADYRALEGRHSGNGFSYAKEEGYLNKYSIVGLHENYNAQQMMTQLQANDIDFSTYESIFLRNELSYLSAVKKGLSFVGNTPYGIELDCDAIENIPSSAQTPAGISALQARQYMHWAGSSTNASYLHLPEAAPSLVPNSEEQVGKLLSYLVSDFIKARAFKHSQAASL